MPDYPLFADGQRATSLITSPGGLDSTSGVELTASATIGTNGPRVILTEGALGTTPFTCGGIIVSVMGITSGKHFITLWPDLTTATPLVERMMLGAARVSTNLLSSMGGQYYYWPITIPGITALYGSVSSSVASAKVKVACTLLGQGSLMPDPLSRVTTYGTTGTAGTQVTMATANTLARSTIITATTRHTRLVMVAMSMRGLAVGTTNAGRYLWNLEVSSANQVLIPWQPGQVHATSDQIAQSVFGPYPCHIPAGTQINISCQKSGNNTIDPEFAVYGIS